MILSYHPFFVADRNIICAGRNPDSKDLSAIRASDAVILPQGCSRPLYEMARQNCARVFPNFDVRFGYGGKVGQARLFRELNVSHPETRTFRNLETFYIQYGKNLDKKALAFPFIFKFDWGGEGHHVYLIKSPDNLKNLLKVAESFEATGRSGFLVQTFFPSKNRTLRVAVVGETFISYWRVLKGSPDLRANLSRGAEIDADADPELQQAAVSAVKAFCRRTGINLAGFDLLFAPETSSTAPQFLEINYYFGRKGLGGSEAFYKLLCAEILKWLDGVGLSTAGS